MCAVRAFPLQNRLFWARTDFFYIHRPEYAKKLHYNIIINIAVLSDRKRKENPYTIFVDLRALGVKETAAL